MARPRRRSRLPDLDGNRQALADFRGRPLLLLFFNPRCGFCTQIAGDLATLATEDDGRPLPLIVSTGDAAENRQLAEAHAIRAPFLLQTGMEVAAQYLANGTPMGYLIDAQGQIASELAIGGPALLELARRPVPTAGSPGPQPVNGNGHAPLGGKRSPEDSKLNRSGLPAGTPAPNFRLPLLHGGELSLDDYRGRRVLLVFSDPQCGPCDPLSRSSSSLLAAARGHRC